MAIPHEPDYAREVLGYLDVDVDESLLDRFRGLRPIIDPAPAGRAGALIGALAGPTALFAVQTGAGAGLGEALATTAHAREVPIAVSYAVAYGAASVFGGVVGAAFAVVTRYLRKWLPLVFWALVFFVSLAVLALAAADHYGLAAGWPLSGAVVLGAAVFGGLVSFSLPIQRRR